MTAFLKRGPCGPSFRGFTKSHKNGWRRGKEFVAVLASKKFLWRWISTKYVLHNEFKSFLDHKLVNRCKCRVKKRFITVACFSPWVHSATHVHQFDKMLLSLGLYRQGLAFFMNKVFEYIFVCFTLIHRWKQEDNRLFLWVITQHAVTLPNLHNWEPTGKHKSKILHPSMFLADWWSVLLDN